MGTKGRLFVAGIWEVRFYGSHLRGNVCEPAQGASGSDTGGPPDRSRAQKDLWNSGFSWILKEWVPLKTWKFAGPKTESE